MKKFVTVIALLCCVLSAKVFAEDVKAGSVKAPGKGKVLLVGRVSFKSPIEYDDKVKALGYDVSKYKTKNYYSLGDAKKFELEEPFYVPATVNDDGTVTVSRFLFKLYGINECWFRLPASVKVHVPDGASYVYVGNFEYDLDYALRVKGFKHYDEFDKAQKWVDRATGTSCDLVRAELDFQN